MQTYDAPPEDEPHDSFNQPEESTAYRLERQANMNDIIQAFKKEDITGFEELQKQHYLDLSWMPGGFNNEATQALAWFLPKSQARKIRLGTNM